MCVLLLWILYENVCFGQVQWPNEFVCYVAHTIEIALWPVRANVICKPLIGAITCCKDSSVYLEVWASTLIKTLSLNRWAFFGVLCWTSLLPVEGSSVRMWQHQANAENIRVLNDMSGFFSCCWMGGGSFLLIVSRSFVVFSFNMNSSQISTLLI